MAQLTRSQNDTKRTYAKYTRFDSRITLITHPTSTQKGAQQCCRLENIAAFIGMRSTSKTAKLLMHEVRYLRVSGWMDGPSHSFDLKNSHFSADASGLAIFCYCLHRVMKTMLPQAYCRRSTDFFLPQSKAPKAQKSAWVSGESILHFVCVVFFARLCCHRVKYI